jgi:KDO2-lipid IV(A) lauroyltransferase
MAIREAAGVEVMSRGNSARQSLVKLRKNQMIGILADQNSKDCYVPFFNMPCGTVNGPAVLHQRTGAMLLPTFCVWEDYARYRVVVLPPVDPENQEPDTEKITADLNLALESMIRKHPEQWLWMHDRWKSARQLGLLNP